MQTTDFMPIVIQEIASQ